MMRKKNHLNLIKYGFSFQAFPWSFYRGNTIKFWVHYGLVILGFLLAVITFVVQWLKPAPYGKHERNVSKCIDIFTSKIRNIRYN